MTDHAGTPGRPLLKPIEFQYMHQSVYEQIRDVLMKGGFFPGQKVSSRKLAAQLGTSDMPVRAVLLRLLAEGISATENRDPSQSCGCFHRDLAGMIGDPEVKVGI